MKREDFVRLVEEALDSLPKEFRKRMSNIAVLVEDLPPEPLPSQGSPHDASSGGVEGNLLLGLFHGVPMTRKSVFDLPTGPDYVTLYQKNIEAVCSTQEEIREQIRMTVIHEVGHYFGMDEEQLKDVR